MKIAIITSGLLPIPASKGGAIETLVDSFVFENEKYKKLDITIYSIANKEARKIVKTNNYKNVNYVFINGISNFVIRVINKLLKKNIPINKYYQKKVVKKVNKKNYDYVIVENYPELAINLKNNKIIPYIHSDVFNKEIDNAKEILDKCYKVITVSDFIKNRVVDIDKNQNKKVFTIYNSIDFETYNEDKYLKNRSEYRNKYGINDNDYVYVYSGRLSKEKGILELIKSFNKINVPNKKLLIIGGIWYGSKKKNDYLRELESMSGSDVIYTGYVEHKEVMNILCACDVGVVPSTCNEAAGLSVVEFMNARNIVVASNMGGISEYLNQDDNILVEYNSKFESNLKEGLEKSYNVKNKEKVKENNLEFVKKFSTLENYNNIINILEGD